MRKTPLLLTGLAIGGLLALGGCQKTVKAPAEDKVCYFIGHPAKDEFKYVVIGRNVDDMEHCAALVYDVRRTMIGTGTAGPETEGSYGGSFLFVTNRDVRVNDHYYGPRFPFLIRTPDNRFVPPGAVEVEGEMDKPADNGPQTIEIPKDLPKKP
jgi:hypothetical protein